MAAREPKIAFHPASGGRRAAGFARRDLVTVVVCILVAAGLYAVIMPPVRQARRDSWQMTDALHVRETKQAMASWSESHAGAFPLPSLVDLRDATVADAGDEKNTTANIYSMLIFNGYVKPEGLVSPAEPRRSRIRVDTDYKMVSPSKAVRPVDALWDPAFAVDFVNGWGNTSYAHIQPGGARLQRWRDTFSSTEPVVANRGPEITALHRGKDRRAIPELASAHSNTLLIHGGPDFWMGNVAYNDGHVQCWTRMDPDDVIYRDSTWSSWSDCLFYDEPDDPAGTNAFMSIWTKAGSTNAAFKGIWD